MGAHACTHAEFSHRVSPQQPPFTLQAGSPAMSQPQRVMHRSPWGCPLTLSDLRRAAFRR